MNNRVTKWLVIHLMLLQMARARGQSSLLECLVSEGEEVVVARGYCLDAGRPLPKILACPAFSPLR